MEKGCIFAQFISERLAKVSWHGIPNFQFGIFLRSGVAGLFPKKTQKSTLTDIAQHQAFMLHAVISPIVTSSYDSFAKRQAQ